MCIRQILIGSIVGLSLTLAGPKFGLAQNQIFSTTPPTVEYQYQLYYPRYWGWGGGFGGGWNGPGLSLGGSLPANGREGISSFYGAPMPVPFGAGVYVNPFAYSARLPSDPLNPIPYGLASKTPSTSSTAQTQGGMPPVPSPLPGAGGGVTQAAAAGQAMPVGQAYGANAVRLDSTNAPVPMSTPDSVQRSKAMESFGDDNLRNQQWTQAYINYRNAVITAVDRAEPHVRLGLVCIVMNRFPEAAAEFKRALAIDPTIGRTGESLESIVGYENPLVRTQMVNSVATWAKQNLKDQDRLFLLGLMLQYNKDGRSSEILTAALRMPGPNEHLLALMSPSVPSVETVLAQPPLPSLSVIEPIEPIELPELNQEPIALQ